MFFEDRYNISFMIMFASFLDHQVQEEVSINKYSE